MKDYFDCGVASVISNDCLDDIYGNTESKIIRKFPKDCKNCEGYGNCEYCSLENSTYCCECIYFKNK